MTPKELTKLECGATLITFERSMQIYMSTLNSSITIAANKIIPEIFPDIKHESSIGGLKFSQPPHNPPEQPPNIK